MSDTNSMGGGVAIALDLAVEAGGWPPEDVLRALVRRAVEAAAAHAGADLGRWGALSLLFTGDAQIRAVNRQWRGKDRPTNVLSFPAAASPVVAPEKPSLGDIVLAYETVAREAEAEAKSFDDHLTHLVVHGFLHLLGYDHETDEDAEEMEALERKVLESLAIGDPYA